LEKFYNNKALENDRKKWAEKEWYIESIAWVLENNELVGFILGWADWLEHLNEEKFQLNEWEYNILKQQIQQATWNISTERLFYAADLWIKPEYRNLWIASKLYNDRHEKIIQNREKVVIVRTTKNRPVPYNRYIDKWFKEVYHYNDQQNRVIMILPIL